MKTTLSRLDQLTPLSIRGYFTIILISLVQLFYSNSSIAASRVFFDNFDGGISSSWMNNDPSIPRDMCKSLTTASDGGSTNSGTGMLSCNWNGVVAWNNPASFEGLDLANFDYNSEFLIRFWIRADADGDYPSPTYPDVGPKFFRFGSQSPSSSFATFDFRGRIKYNFKDGATKNLITPIIYGSNTGDTNWHKVEIYIYEHATNGIIKVWEDDNLIANRTNLDTVHGIGDWGRWYISSNWSGGVAGSRNHDENNHIYWDNFEIYSDIGSGAVGSLSAGTISVSEIAPPNPPIPE